MLALQFRSPIVNPALPAPMAAAGSGLQRGTADTAARGGDRLGLCRPTAQQAGPRCCCSLGRRRGIVSATAQQCGQQLRGPLGPVPGQSAGDRCEAGQCLSRVVTAAAAASARVGAVKIKQRGGSGVGAGPVGRCRDRSELRQRCRRVRGGATAAGSRRVERPGRRAAAGAAGGCLPPAPVVRCFFIDFQGPSATGQALRRRPISTVILPTKQVFGTKLSRNSGFCSSAGLTPMEHSTARRSCCPTASSLAAAPAAMPRTRTKRRWKSRGDGLQKVRQRLLCC